jgi:putative hydrolase of the HAD superfamily
VFDLNDTIVHGGEPGLRDRVSHAMARDLGVDPEAFTASVRDSFDARCRGTLGDLQQTILCLANRLGADPTRPAVRAAAERRLDLVRKLLSPAPQTLEMLDGLRRSGYRLGLISDCSAETPMLWRQTALADRFDVTIFSCEMGIRKPDPALYHAAAAGLGVMPEDCLYVGDGASDELAGAQRAGMTALQVSIQVSDPVTHADRSRLYGVRPWDGPIIENITELGSLLNTADGVFTLSARYSNRKSV